MNISKNNILYSIEWSVVMASLNKHRARLSPVSFLKAMSRTAVDHAPAAGGAAVWSIVCSGPATAQVTGGTDPATMVNNICAFILGPFGQSLAVLGIVAIGISWMFGRASLGLVASVIGGIVIMFGASFLGKALIGAG